MDRASVSGTEGRRFKSSQARHHLAVVFLFPLLFKFNLVYFTAEAGQAKIWPKSNLKKQRWCVYEEISLILEKGGKSMTESEVLELFGEVDAIITGSHIVYTSGKHGSAYVDKDAIYPHAKMTSRLCKAIAEKFAWHSVDVVIAPTIGGVILSQWTAYYLSGIKGREIFGVYAEKAESGDTFIIKRGYDKLIARKNVLVVEDVLTTGSSAKKVIEATRVAGGEVIGLGVLCNRGGITPQDVANPPKLFALVNIKLDTWNEADCPLCVQGAPINTDVGKGREFLDRNKDKFLVCYNPKCKGLAQWVDKEQGVWTCIRCGSSTAGVEFE